jgi:putative spermidine/putrescine transport system permease protein
MSNAYLAKSLPDSSDQGQPPLTNEHALAREERKEHASMLLLLAPALVMVVVLLILPLCWLAVQSVQTEEGFSLVNYLRIFQEAIYWDTFALTFKITILVTILGQPGVDRSDPAVLDQCAGALLRLAGAAATTWSGESDAD